MAPPLTSAKPLSWASKQGLSEQLRKMEKGPQLSNHGVQGVSRLQGSMKMKGFMKEPQGSVRREKWRGVGIRQGAKEWHQVDRPPA